jgi:membrane-bound lytic murein transglycosylase F
MNLLAPKLGRHWSTLLFVWRTGLFLGFYMVGFLASHIGHGLTDLDAIQASGTLRVASKPGATTYLDGPDGPMGFEYELLSGFAESLGVELQLVPVDSFSAFEPMLNSGEVHMAASGISRTQQRADALSLGPGYQTIHEVVVYRAGTPRPRHVDDLDKGRIGVLAGTSYEETLRRYRQQQPGLTWVRYYESGIEELLSEIARGTIDFTIIDNHLFQVHRRFYPSVRYGFTIENSQNELVWLFPKQGMGQLEAKAAVHFEQIGDNGELADLRQRFYHHVEAFDFIGSFSFLRHMQGRLPRYLALFKAAAHDNDFDWRLLAAQGYQESHWDPDAVSRTGVRGIMMLTLDAASDLGVNDRRDPAESIEGGARYLRSLYSRLPDRIAPDDRLWLALAAYNVGFGHMEDARVLTERNGYDPDRWLDVKQHLPLLAQKKWYSQTRWGYARGWEPVQYVENIRSYYDILLWHTRDGGQSLVAQQPTTPTFTDFPETNNDQQATGLIR